MKIDLSNSTKKENSTENSAEMYLKEDSKFYEFWNVSTKQKKKKKKRKEKKRKEKYSNLKNFVYRILYTVSSSKLYKKFATLSFLSLSFLIPLYKSPFWKHYCLSYLFKSVSELENCRTYCLNLPFELLFNIAHWKPLKKHYPVKY